MPKDFSSEDLSEMIDKVFGPSFKNIPNISGELVETSQPDPSFNSTTVEVAKKNGGSEVATTITFPSATNAIITNKPVQMVYNCTVNVDMSQHIDNRQVRTSESHVATTVAGGDSVISAISGLFSKLLNG